MESSYKLLLEEAWTVLVTASAPQDVSGWVQKSHGKNHARTTRSGATYDPGLLKGFNLIRRTFCVISFTPFNMTFRGDELSRFMYSATVIGVCHVFCASRCVEGNVRAQ